MKDSWFSKTGLSISTIVQFTYCWSQRYPQYILEHELGISHQTSKPNPESLGKTTTLTLITGWGNNPNRNHWMGKPKTDVQSLDISRLSIQAV